MLTDNQIKWALKYAEYLNNNNREYLAGVIIALKHNLFPDTEPVFNGEDMKEVLNIVNMINDESVIRGVKSEIEQLEVKQ